MTPNEWARLIFIITAGIVGAGLCGYIHRITAALETIAEAFKEPPGGKSEPPA